MKWLLTLSLLIALVLSVHGCSQTDRDIINDPFPEAQAEVTEILKKVYEAAQPQDLK